MSVPADRPLYHYTLMTESCHDHGEPSLVTVMAMYFVEDHSYTLFKDDQHAVVYGVPTKHVLYVQRGETV